jgi:hypothetical protein
MESRTLASAIGREVVVVRASDSKEIDAAIAAFVHSGPAPSSSPLMAWLLLSSCGPLWIVRLVS